MVKLVFFVPESHLETVKSAVFAAGAGRIGRYDHCCWQIQGEGQFRPLPGSNPALGEHFQLHQLMEYRVEMVCDDACIVAAVSALRAVHPYEMPAFEVLSLMDLSHE